MLDAVQDLTCKNMKSVRAAQEKGEKIEWIRNDEGLKAAAEIARGMLDEIEAEWRAKADASKK